MLDENQIKIFEEQLFEIADEKNIKLERKQTIRSVLDDDEDETQQRALSDIIASSFAEEGLSLDDFEEPSLEETEDISEPTESVEPVPSSADDTLTDIATETTETVDISEPEPVEPVPSSVDDTPLDIAAETTETVDISEPTAPVEPVPSSVDDTPTDTDTEFTEISLQEESTPPTPPTQVEEVEEVEDNIDEIAQEEVSLEEISPEEISNAEYTLPSKYLQMPTLSSLQEPPDSTTSEIDTDTEQSEDESIDEIDSLLDSANSIFDNEDIDGESSLDNDIEYSSEEIASMYDSTGELDKQQERYHSTRSFEQQDEDYFIERLDNFNIELKEAVISIMLNESLKEEAEQLTDLILDNAAPATVHRECEKILQRNIHIVQESKIFSNYSDLKQQLLTLAEAAKRTTKFLLLRIVPIASILLLSSFYGYIFGVQPIRAWYLYEQGFNLLQEEQLEKSEDKFIQATKIWPFRKYFYSYANEYLQRKEYDNARKKYEQLIFGTNEKIRSHIITQIQQQNYFASLQIRNKDYVISDMISFSPRAFKTLADFEITTYQNFEQAQSYYNYWITQYPNNIEAHTHLGNLYIDWYDYTNDVWYLEQANASYNKMISLTNRADTSLILKIRWAVRSDDEEYINYILGGILQNELISISDTTLTPYLEVLEYKLQKNSFIHMGFLLDLLNEYDPTIIDLPFWYAQYYEDTQQFNALQTSLLQAINRYTNTSGLSNIQYAYLVKSYMMLSKLVLEYENNILTAREHINQAQILFESLEDSLKTEDIANLAQLYFSQSQLELIRGDVSSSDKYLQQALKRGYTSDNLVYHQGVINYLNKDWGQAAERFISLLSTGDFDYLQKNILLLATGNALFYHKNYIAASVYYKQLLELLTQQQTQNPVNIITLDLNYNTGIKQFYEQIAQIQNNLGAALYYATKRSINNKALKYQAILEMQQSDYILQQTARQNLVRSTEKSIPFTNIASIIDDTYEFDIEIYPEISYALDYNMHLNTEKLIVSHN